MAEIPRKTWINKIPLMSVQHFWNNFLEKLNSWFLDNWKKGWALNKLWKHRTKQEFILSFCTYWTDPPICQKWPLFLKSSYMELFKNQISKSSYIKTFSIVCKYLLVRYFIVDCNKTFCFIPITNLGYLCCHFLVWNIKKHWVQDQRLNNASHHI